MSSGPAGGDAIAAPPLSESQFVACYGEVYEESPWVARIAWWEAPHEIHRDAGALHACMKQIVERAPRDIQLALLRAHPDLAGRAALAGGVSADSAREQSSAGLDRCAPDEYAEFQQLNGAYRARFAFPFIVAVGGLHRAQILALFRLRLGNSVEAEFRTCLAEVHKIARMRLDALTARAAPGATS